MHTAHTSIFKNRYLFKAESHQRHSHELRSLSFDSSDSAMRGSAVMPTELDACFAKHVDESMARHLQSISNPKESDKGTISGT